jgi:predicted alpha/beta-hydrolase family hydrolase
MNAVVLGGMSSRHREWVLQVAEALGPEYEIVRSLNYRHWEHPGSEMDIEYEIARLAELAQGLAEYVVVAKSIGTVVATIATMRGLLRPKRCLFMGFPLKVVMAELPEVASALPLLPLTTFLHNEHDPLGGAEAVLAYIVAHAPEAYTLQTLPGSTHDYVNFDLIKQLATEA